ncbi:HTH domain-containing protein [Nocardioides exalbidus]|uniref:HTH domain-containing protein n=1 Tax=Nocardioides exalbidus TaxID=402596 RepID=A0A1H4WEL3_9ACTN|nr:HTH domain-containing protein [Nocardioides exalbidus]SEC91717.1 HTH domain-containing protein [Nocardioides exalbidus]
MDPSVGLAAASRDGHLALRRVERQQWLVERLYAAHGALLVLDDLAAELGVSGRTIARDVARLRDAGLPIETRQGRDGGVRLDVSGDRLRPVDLDLPEIAALLSSLAVLGPSASESASSAALKLAAALGGETPAGRIEPDRTEQGST